MGSGLNEVILSLASLPPPEGKVNGRAAWLSFHFPGWLRVAGLCESKCGSRSQEMGKDGEQELKLLRHGGSRRGKAPNSLTCLQLGAPGWCFSTSSSPQTSTLYFLRLLFVGSVIKRRFGSCQTLLHQARQRTLRIEVRGGRM